MNNRLKSLLDFYEEDNNDAFTIYALGMEFLNIDKQKSLAYFEELISKHPRYISVYYQLGKLYFQINDEQKALTTIENGINFAKEAKDFHTQSELQNLSTNIKLGLLDEED